MNFAIQPASLTIRVGDTVRWTTQQGVHTSTSGTSPNPDGRWNSGTLGSGQSFSLTFTQAGTFPYFCSFHPTQMQATITVTP